MDSSANSHNDAAQIAWIQHDENSADAEWVITDLHHITFPWERPDQIQHVS